MRSIGSALAIASSQRDREVVVRAAVVDFDPDAHVRSPVAHLGHAVAQARVEEQRLGIGVVEEVDEFVFGVPVVDVHRDAAHLERRVQALEVLIAVVEVRRDLGTRLQARRAERGREAGGAVVELGPRAPPFALHDRYPIGDGVGHRFPQGREVPVHVFPRFVVSRRAVSQPRYRGRMPPRGGQQRIPRPPSYRPGRPAPWAHIEPADRHLTLDDVRTRLALLAPAARRFRS